MSNWSEDIEAEFQEFRKNSEIIKLVEEAVERSKKHKEWLSSLTDEERENYEKEQQEAWIKWILEGD